MTQLAPTLQAFFTGRLIGQPRASVHTVASYRDTFRLLLAYLAQTTGKTPAELGFDDLDATTIGGFLTHLEHDRGVSAATRNARLAAIRSLFTFAAYRHPEHAELITRVPRPRCIAPPPPRGRGDTPDQRRVLHSRTDMVNDHTCAPCRHSTAAGEASTVGADEHQRRDRRIVTRSHTGRGPRPPAGPVEHGALVQGAPGDDAAARESRLRSSCRSRESRSTCQRAATHRRVLRSSSPGKAEHRSSL